MAMYEPAYLPPNAEEQDFIQAYENVREKYKEKPATFVSSVEEHSSEGGQHRHDSWRNFVPAEFHPRPGHQSKVEALLAMALK
ncbi:hypothetical protein D4764_10G0006280 [Takifugu flavidus]|uniref:Uncharacterized protein n=1 Tax=Takifugu flavidus TaxID=433684 RepID=A0A5C6PLJ6_9TELE|nr:hypothetical protein D4764_10G0006280 [Takifugu flavidus]